MKSNVLIRLSVVCLYLFSGVITNAQVINTVAGVGVGSASGDSGLAISAHTPYPSFCFFDAKSNLYFGSSIANPQIRVIYPSGIINKFAGNGNPGFSGDSGLAINAKISNTAARSDNFGNIYIADYYNCRVRKVNSTTGIITTIAGNGTPAHTGDNAQAVFATIHPSDVCSDAYGNIFITDSARIRKIDTSGIITTIAGTGTGGFTGDSGAAAAANILVGIGICFDTKGNLYVGCNSGTRIRKINMSSGVISTIAGTGLAAYNGDSILATTAQFKEYGIICDKNDNLFIADYFNNRIRKIDTNGIIYTVAGNGIAGFSGDNGLATLAQIYYPQGVAIDDCGNLYIADENNDRIRKVTFDTACHLQSLNVHQETAEASAVNVYPNPATTELTITSPIEISEMTISNMLGQKVITQHQSSPGNKEIKINIAGLPLGMYFVTVTDSEGQKTVRKIVKQ